MGDYFRRSIRARMKDDLLRRLDEFFGQMQGCRSDEKLRALCERIKGKEVTLVFTGDDAFEREDDNYWLPDCTWEPISGDRHG